MSFLHFFINVVNEMLRYLVIMDQFFRLNISNQQAAHISNAAPGEGLIFFGNVVLPFVDDFPKDNELYSIMTTKLGETGKGENEHE